MHPASPLANKSVGSLRTSSRTPPRKKQFGIAALKSQKSLGKLKMRERRASGSFLPALRSKLLYRFLLLLAGTGIALLQIKQISRVVTKSERHQNSPALTEAKQAGQSARNEDPQESRLQLELTNTTAFQHVCRHTRLGDLDRALVSGNHISYCYPQKGAFQELISLAIADQQQQRLRREKELRTKALNLTMLTQPEDEQPKPPLHETIFVVTSAAPNLSRRNAIRQTWADEGYAFFLVSAAAGGGKHKRNETISDAEFEAQSEVVMQQLMAEMDQYGDMILVDVPDLYRAETNRFAAFLHAARTHLLFPKEVEEEQPTFFNETTNHQSKPLTTVMEPIYHYIYKSTEDTYVKIDRMDGILHMRGDHYYGICNRDEIPVRHIDSEFYVSRELYPGSHAAFTEENRKVLKENVNDVYFPPFAKGIAYGMSQFFVDCAVEHLSGNNAAIVGYKQDSNTTRLAQVANSDFLYMPNEDVAVGMLAERCRIPCADTVTVGQFKTSVMVRHKVKSEEEMRLLDWHYGQKTDPATAAEVLRLGEERKRAMENGQTTFSWGKGKGRSKEELDAVFLELCEQSGGMGEVDQVRVDSRNITYCYPRLSLENSGNETMAGGRNATNASADFNRKIKSGKEFVVVSGVMSSAENYERRNAIRRTWGGRDEYIENDNGNGTTISLANSTIHNQVVFVIAAHVDDVYTDAVLHMKKLMAELQDYGDVFLVNVHDTYRAETNRLFAFLHAVEHHFHYERGSTKKEKGGSSKGTPDKHAYDYILRVRDDVSLNMTDMKEALSESQTNYLGSCVKEVVPERSPKSLFYVSEDTYPKYIEAEERRVRKLTAQEQLESNRHVRELELEKKYVKNLYPPYATAYRGYAVSSRFVHCAMSHMGDHQKNTGSPFPYMPNEDVSVGMLAQRCDVSCEDSTMFNQEAESEEESRGLDDNYDSDVANARNLGEIKNGKGFEEEDNKETMVAFEKGCLSTKKGRVDRVVVARRNVTYCYPYAAFDQIKMSKGLQELEDSTKIVAGVTSSAGNTARRNAIRRTWGRDGHTVFMVPVGKNASGFGTHGTSMETLLDELAQHGDIILIAVEESYQEGTKKTMAFLHALGNHLGADAYRHVLKTRDDIFINFDGMTPYLIKETPPDYLGLCKEGVRPERYPKSSFYVSEEQFSADVYPTYALSTGYVLSSKFVQCAIGRQHSETKKDEDLLYMPNEDVAIGMLAEQCDVVCTNAGIIRRFESQVFVRHQVKSMAEMKILHEHFSRRGNATVAKQNNGRQFNFVMKRAILNGSPSLTAFEIFCTWTNVGKAGHAVVAGRKITYCYPRAKFEIGGKTKTELEKTQRDHGFQMKVGVLSLAANAQRRQAIRNTWGGDGDVLFIVAAGKSGKTVKPGKTSRTAKSESTSSLMMELAQNKDMLLVDTEEMDHADMKGFMALLHVYQINAGRLATDGMTNFESTNIIESHQASSSYTFVTNDENYINIDEAADILLQEKPNCVSVDDAYVMSSTFIDCAMQHVWNSNATKDLEIAKVDVAIGHLAQHCSIQCSNTSGLWNRSS